MISAIILASGLVCPVPFIMNETDVWNKADSQTFLFTKKRCGMLYKDAPCLKLFWKYEHNSYRVICGEEMK